MTAVDHLFALALVLALPAYAAWDVPRLARRLTIDPLNARTTDYLWTMAVQWSLTIALLGSWWSAARPLRDLGVRLPAGAGPWSWTLVIAGAVIAFFVWQTTSILTSPDSQAQVRKQLASQPAVRTILPATPREMRVFSGIAVTAGICEELLYRGYLLWYLHGLLPGPAAIAVAIALFGVAHAYQGLRGVVMTGLAGSVAMGLYLLTGSLLAPMVLHATVDFANGLAVYHAFRAQPAEGEAAS